MEESEHIKLTIESPEKKDLERPRDVPFWYVIRVTYGRERKLAEVLKEREIKYFLPMKTVHYNRPRDGKLKKKQVSVVPNLIFVYDTRNNIQELKEEIEGKIPMRYQMDRNTKQPMVVRQKQMEDFIRVAGEDSESLLYLDNPDIVLEKGMPVEIIYGPFAGVKGYILRIRRDRKIVLMVEGLFAAAIKTEIRKEWIKKIPE